MARPGAAQTLKSKVWIPEDLGRKPAKLIGIHRELLRQHDMERDHAWFEIILILNRWLCQVDWFSWLTAVINHFSRFILLSSAITNVAQFTFINSNNATILSAFHRFLVLELISDSSKNQTNCPKNLFANVFRWSIFRPPLARWVKPGAFCYWSEHRTLIGQFSLNCNFLLFMRKTQI